MPTPSSSMSENPFSATLARAPQVPIKKRAPWVTVICAVCIILGGLGLLGSGLGILGTIVSQVMMANAPSDNPGMAVQMKLQELNRPYMVPQYLLLGGNLVVAALLLSGGIAVLQGGQRGFAMLRWALLLAALFVIIRTATQVFIQLAVMKNMMAVMADAQIQMEQSIFRISMIVGIGLAVVWAMLLVAFYLSAYFYLNRERAKVEP